MVNCADLAHRATKSKRRSIFSSCGFLAALIALFGTVGDVTAQEWRSAAPMPSSRYGIDAVELGGDIYVIGGRDRYGHPLASLLRYDPETDIWDSELPEMDRPLADPAAVVLDGMIYVIGGAGNDDEPSDEVVVYDPVAQSWSPVEGLNFSRFGHRAVVVDKRIWVVGGRDDDGHLVGEVETYHPESDDWAVVSEWTLQNPRVSFALVAIADILYAMFGYGSSGPIPAAEQFGPLTEVDVFVLSELLRGRLATVTVDNTAYLLGGRAEPDRVIGEVLLFTPSADNILDRWRYGPDMLTSRESFAAVTVGNDIYAIGGRTEDGGRDGVTLSSMEVLSVSSTVSSPRFADGLSLTLEQNHPNPFTNSTAIPFIVTGETSERVSLRVYDLRGRLVDTVLDGRLAPGRHKVTWTSGLGGDLPSGVYSYVLRQGENREVKQMTYIR